MDPRVEAIRNDPVIGRGTCSTVDECMTDAELVEYLNLNEITDPAKAIADLRETERLYWEVQNELRAGYGGE